MSYELELLWLAEDVYLGTKVIMEQGIIHKYGTCRIRENNFYNCLGQGFELRALRRLFRSESKLVDRIRKI